MLDVQMSDAGKGDDGLVVLDFLDYQLQASSDFRFRASDFFLTPRQVQPGFPAHTGLVPSSLSGVRFGGRFGEG